MNIESQQWKPLDNHKKDLLPKRPNHPFFMKWHPSNWQFCYFDVEEKKGKTTQTVSKGFFVPYIRMERIRPGVNGVHQIEREIGNPSSRIGKLQQEGWEYLDPRKFDYMKVYPVAGGRYHIPNWVHLKVVANRVIEKADQNHKNLWSIELMLNGHIAKPEDHFWELAIIDKEQAPRKLITKQHIPQIKIKIDKLTKELDDMRQAVLDYQQNGLDVYKVLFNEPIK